jgi:hypothetical protein
VDVAPVQEAAADRLPRAALEEDVVGDDDRSAPVDLEEGADVLQEVELLVAGRRPEVLTQIAGVLLLDIAPAPITL